jgi:hypothetical protein
MTTRKLIEEFFDRYSPINPQGIIDAMNARMDSLGFEGASVVSADYDEEGNIFVTFADDEGEVDVIFKYDREDGAYAIIEDEDEEYAYLIHLDALLPPIDDTCYGEFINMTDSSWMNGSFFYAILSGCEMDSESEDPRIETDSLFGLQISESGGRKVSVIRGGKKVKLAIVRKKRRKVMSGSQRSAMRAAARKRGMKKSIIQRKRKRSLAIRKRMNLKKPKLNRNQKIQGGANRKK